MGDTEAPTLVGAFSGFTPSHFSGSDMNPSGITRQRLAAVFLLGCALMNYPLLSLFNRPGEILDVPLLYIYVFVAWAVLIALMAYVIEKRKD
jgi:hypothetical protein